MPCAVRGFGNGRLCQGGAGWWPLPRKPVSNVSEPRDCSRQLRGAVSSGCISDESAGRIDRLLGVDVGPEGELFNPLAGILRALPRQPCRHNLDFYPIFLDLSAPGSHFGGRANRKCSLCAAGRPVPTIAGPARDFLAAANQKLPSSRLPVIQLNWASRNLQRNP